MTMMPAELLLIICDYRKSFEIWSIKSCGRLKAPRKIRRLILSSIKGGRPKRHTQRYKAFWSIDLRTYYSVMLHLKNTLNYYMFVLDIWWSRGNIYKLHVNKKHLFWTQQKTDNKKHQTQPVCRTTSASRWSRACSTDNPRNGLEQVETLLDVVSTHRFVEGFPLLRKKDGHYTSQKALLNVW